MLSDLPVLYAEHIALFAGSIFVLGLVVGSFLNVVIYRLPIILERGWRDQGSQLVASAWVQTAVVGADDPSRFTLSIPRSACPACKTPITALQNIPIVS